MSVVLLIIEEYHPSLLGSTLKQHISVLVVIERYLSGTGKQTLFINKWLLILETKAYLLLQNLVSRGYIDAESIYS